MLDHRFLLAITLLFPAVAACRSNQSEAVAVVYPDGGTRWVTSTTLTAGPTQHAALTDRQKARIATLQKVFAEVDGSSLEKWLDDFKHDANVDRELAVYEDIARAYESYIGANPTVGRKAKEEVYSLLLMRSGATEEQTLARARLHVLDQKQARDVLRGYSQPPRPIRVTDK